MKHENKTNNNTYIEDDYAIISYTQVKTDDKTFFNEMETHEIYDNRIPLDIFNKLQLKRWGAFGRQAKEKMN